MPDTWQDTAKRLAAHPEWVWLEGVLVQWEDLSTAPGGRIAAGVDRIKDHPWPANKSGWTFWPVLTDWPTAGVLLGMVEVELAKTHDGIPLRLIMACWGNGPVSLHVSGDWKRQSKYCQYGTQHPGQALAELWLELQGET